MSELAGICSVLKSKPKIWSWVQWVGSGCDSIMNPSSRLMKMESWWTTASPVDAVTGCCWDQSKDTPGKNIIDEHGVVMWPLPSSPYTSSKKLSEAAITAVAWNGESCWWLSSEEKSLGISMALTPWSKYDTSSKESASTAACHVKANSGHKEPQRQIYNHCNCAPALNSLNFARDSPVVMLPSWQTAPASEGDISPPAPGCLLFTGVEVLVSFGIGKGVEANSEAYCLALPFTNSVIALKIVWSDILLKESSGGRLSAYASSRSQQKLGFCFLLHLRILRAASTAWAAPSSEM